MICKIAVLIIIFCRETSFTDQLFVNESVEHLLLKQIYYLAEVNRTVQIQPYSGFDLF